MLRAAENIHTIRLATDEDVAPLYAKSLFGLQPLAMMIFNPNLSRISSLFLHAFFRFHVYIYITPFVPYHRAMNTIVLLFLSFFT